MSKPRIYWKDTDKQEMLDKETTKILEEKQHKYMYEDHLMVVTIVLY